MDVLRIRLMLLVVLTCAELCKLKFRSGTRVCIVTLVISSTQ